ncbi:MAG TPA: hypothetical protein PLU36_10045, partial [Chitinophagaceae bacterium]|nr:hypothetical protein [Chitinophagaceae bacterium]
MKYWVTILLVLQGYIGNTQYNLVPNYSFEDSVVCPSDINGGPLPAPWYLPQNVPNKLCYFHSCSTSSNYSVPNNVGNTSFQYAKTGQGYAGVDVYNSLSFFDGRYYLQTKLKSLLQIGGCYYAEFWVSLLNYSRIATNNIAMLVTDTAILVDASYDAQFGIGLIPANPQIFNYGNPVITDTLNWVKISGVFTAQGGEEYLTIGNFKDDTNTDTLRVNSGVNTYEKAAYYIDDIYLIPLDSMFLHADAGTDKTITQGDSVYIGSYINGINNITWYNSTGSIIATGIPGMYVQPAASTFYVIEQTVCGQYSKDTVYITVGVVPLVIKNYELIIKNEGVVNKWITLNEINVSHLNVQRSSNGVEFNTIQQTAAKNNTYNEYSITDEQPLNGTSYYRIEAVDKDGKRTYTKTEKVQSKIENEKLKIYPNPAKDIVNVSFPKIKQVTVADIIG